jgi:serine/threonine protein kinase
MGTAAYMSPEQVRAKLVDRRADIWAFGCVLYEMLTGKMAFPGESVTDTLAAGAQERARLVAASGGNTATRSRAIAVMPP